MKTTVLLTALIFACGDNEPEQLVEEVQETEQVIEEQATEENDQTTESSEKTDEAKPTEEVEKNADPSAFNTFSDDQVIKAINQMT